MSKRVAAPAGWGTIAPWPHRRGQATARASRRKTWFSASFLLLVAAYALIVPLTDAADPRLVHLGAFLAPPSPEHPMGTDLLGRDLWVRCAQALRISLLIAAAAALASTVIGVLVGALAGAAGGIADRIAMRVVDGTNALPHLLLGLVLLSLFRGQWWAIVASIGLTHWTQVARIVRAEILQVRTLDFVNAAIGAGATRIQVWCTHLLPAVIPQALIAVVLLLPHAVWHESSLSFLGVGLPPNDPSLGTLLEDARAGLLAGGWWLLAFPAGLLAATALALAGLGSALRAGRPSAIGVVS